MQSPEAPTEPVVTSRPAPSGIAAAVATKGRRRLLGATLGLAVVAAVGLTVATDPAGRTLAATSEPAQSLVSVLVPLLGVLLGNALRRTRTSVAATLTSAALAAAASAAVGTAAAAVTVAATSSAPDRWHRGVAVAVGCVAVQVVAQLVGTGLGLLIPLRPVAMAATVILPLGLWAALGAVPGLAAAQPWLTPYAWVPTLLGGSSPATGWAPYAVVIALWAVGLNAVGVLRLRRRP